MPRIPELPLPTTDPLARELIERQVDEYGFVLNTTRVFGYRPTIMRGVGQLQAGIDESGLLDAELKALLNVRVASINGCPF